MSSTGGGAGKQPPVSTGAKAHVAWGYVFGCAPESGRALSTPAQAFPKSGRGFARLAPQQVSPLLLGLTTGMLPFPRPGCLAGEVLVGTTLEDARELR